MRNLSRRIPIRGRGYTVAYQTCGPLSCNTFALVCDETSEAAIIDPSPYTDLEFQILQKHLANKEVKHIFLTHGHCDHVAGVAKAVSAWPDARLYLHPLEQQNYQRAPKDGQIFGITIKEKLPEPTESLKDGDHLIVGKNIKLRVVHTPGHSPGHVGFVDDRSVSQEGGSVIIGGDLLFRGSVGRTDFFNSNFNDLMASIRRLYEEFDEGSIVLSGHTTPTFLKNEVKWVVRRRKTKTWMELNRIELNLIWHIFSRIFLILHFKNITDFPFSDLQDYRQNGNRLNRKDYLNLR